MKKFAAIILTLIAAIVFPQSAIAQTALFTSPHKWTDTVTNKTYVFIPNQTPLTAVPNLISLDESGQVSVQTDNCGWGKTGVDLSIVKMSRLGGAPLNWAGRTKGAAPTCTQNSSSVWISSNPAPIGTVILNGGNAWIKASNSWSSFSVIKDFGAKVTLKANACGFLRVLVSTSRSMKSFSFGAALMNYTLANIPSVNSPMICRKVAGSSFTYIPK